MVDMSGPGVKVHEVMTDVPLYGRPLPGKETAESTGKQHFKQAWTYSQRIELASRGTGHILDLYSANLQDLRRKLREKCMAILLLTCSYRRKAEELLWKRAFYDLIQKSKTNKQALDGKSTLHLMYSEHLSMATAFYIQLLSDLEDHYHLPVTSMDTTQLCAVDGSDGDAQWLRDAAYRCLLYLGDLARYRVDIGGKPYAAVTHYLHAISLDPTNGAVYNQLAALSGNKHEGLDAVYYYMRSLSSAKPFPGTEVNLQQIFRKNADRLESLKGKKERATETNIREATRSLLLARLVTLQHMLSSPKEKMEESFSSLCEELLSDLEACLTFDLQLFIDSCPSCVRDVISTQAEGGGGERGGDLRRVEEQLACLPSDLLLKIAALSVLSATTLRKQGSARTLVFTSFTVSIFSLLLRHSFLRLFHLTRHTIHTLTHGTPSTHTAGAVGGVEDFDPDSIDGDMVRMFLKELKGEVLDKYAQQTPGIARQLRVNSAPTTTLRTVEETVGKLSIGPSSTWGGGGSVNSGAGDSLENGQAGNGEEESGEGERRKERGERREEGGERGEGGRKKENKYETTLKQDGPQNKKGEKKKRKTKVVDRRRQRRRPSWVTTQLSSEDEDEESDHSNLSQCSSSSSEEEEERIDMIDSLSETSLSEEEEDGMGETATQPQRSGAVGGGVIDREEGGERGGGREGGGGGGGERGGWGGGERGGGGVGGGERGGGGRRQIRLAANFSGQTNAPESEKSGYKGDMAADDNLFQTLLVQTRHQAALHLACSLVAEEGYLMTLKIFSDWLTEHPIVITVCCQSCPSLWSRLASLLNFLPPAQEIIAAGLRTTLPPAMEWSQTHALSEDALLRGFAPLSKSHQSLVFEATPHPELLEQACNRICVLQKFGRNLSQTKATAAFQWCGSEGRFLAPLQREREETRAAAIVQQQQEEKAKENRSKLMKAMAQRRLQSEVASLAETSAQQEASVFTPYLLPDALSLCTGLHLIRKLLSSEKFIVIIAKSVIDSLDSMKKGRENYAAREAIKFLERSLQGGGRMVRVQGEEETLQPGRRKPPKMDLNTWRYSGLVDCALYYTHTFAERGSSYSAATTLLLDQSVVKLMESRKKEEDPPLASVLSEAQLNGIPIKTVVRFHSKWIKTQQGSQPLHRYHSGRR